MLPANPKDIDIVQNREADSTAQETGNKFLSLTLTAFT